MANVGAGQAQCVRWSLFRLKEDSFYRMTRMRERISCAMRRGFLAAAFCFSLSTNASAWQLAFPGAEGWGKYTVGGRGGKIIEVTNLNDKGPGSLRAAIQAKGPRIVVFRVSGTIALNVSLDIRNPYITIAGQTAPGDGICLRNYPLVIQTEQVVLRYLRLRLGDESGGQSDAMSAVRQKNIIIDHCSASWSEDETMSIYWCDSTSVQWCLIGESLYESTHKKGAHGYGGIWGGKNSSYHHNLFAHHSSRNPRFARGAGNTDFRNNVIYNWGFNSAYGGEADNPGLEGASSTINVVANYFKPGPATRPKVANRILNPTTENGPEGYGKWFVAENVVVASPDVTNDNWTLGVQGVDESVKKQIRSDAAFSSVPINQQTAEEAYRLVMKNAGATLPKRDTVDARIIRDVETGTATYEGKAYRENQSLAATAPITGIIDSQNDVGGWPILNSSQAPPDSDHDGMPDAWEIVHGLNPHDPGDGAIVGEAGYMNVENYLNAITATVSERK